MLGENQNPTSDLYVKFGVFVCFFFLLILEGGGGGGGRRIEWNRNDGSNIDRVCSE